MPERQKPGPKPKTKTRTARLSMRTYPEVVEAQQAIGNAETERIILRRAAAMKTKGKL